MERQGQKKQFVTATAKQYAMGHIQQLGIDAIEDVPFKKKS